MVEKNKVKVRLRLLIVKDNKILLTHTFKGDNLLFGDYYFYIGGKLEFGETIESGCKREIKEECGENTEFKMEKVLYIRDFIPKENPEEHSVELFILGTINKFEELDNVPEKDHPDQKRMEWKKIECLPRNLYPQELTPILIADFKEGFRRQGVYVGRLK